MLLLLVLFTAGMSLMDTTTAWSCAKPIIGLSLILCAKYFIKPHHDLAIGCLGAHHWYGRTDSGFCEHAGFKQPFFGFFASLDFGYLGYIIVGLFILAWGISIGVWKFGHIEEKYAGKVHSHKHMHKVGTMHSYPHIHRDE